MDILEKYYGKVTLTLYALFMSVPGTNVCHRRIFIAFSIVILSLASTFQILKFLTDGLTLKLVVELVPTIATMFGSLIYVLYFTFAAQVKLAKILSAMQKDLKEERTAEENLIKNHFAVNARLFTNIYIGILIITSCGIPLAGFLPCLLDVFVPMNNSRQIELLFNGELFIDQQKYFYYIYFMESCTSGIVALIVIISENVSIIIGQHICGMFAVVGHRMENLTEIGDQEMSRNISRRDLVVKRLQMCIKSHQTSLQFAVIAIEFYDIPLTLILIGSFCTLTLGLVQVTDPQFLSMKLVIFTSTQFCHLVLMSYMGQIGTDATLRIAQKAYNSKWEDFPTDIRKLLRMVILRSLKPCQVTARGIYVLSIESCMSVVQTILSFYMVLRQSR